MQPKCFPLSRTPSDTYSQIQISFRETKIQINMHIWFWTTIEIYLFSCIDQILSCLINLHQVSQLGLTNQNISKQQISKTLVCVCCCSPDLKLILCSCISSSLRNLLFQTMVGIFNNPLLKVFKDHLTKVSKYSGRDFLLVVLKWGEGMEARGC